MGRLTGLAFFGLRTVYGRGEEGLGNLVPGSGSGLESVGGWWCVSAVLLV